MESTLYRHLGAHLATEDGVSGVKFAVWAPNATEVSILCDRNGWDHQKSPLQSSDNGVWWGFVPQLQHGDPYKFGIRTREGHLLQKSDPFAFAAEIPPKSASIVYNLEGHTWRDDDWIRRRQTANSFEKPVSIYEVHLGSWRRPQDGRKYFNYCELAPMLID
ncbi:MAG: 1,4-alpha-glucan branching enzyme, partial [Planctomycetes bacterium]|nr:1,4-alpha-glucan branching enzyme [Planctomycetota bacterium]